MRSPHLLALLLATNVPLVPEATDAPARKPNILHIHADDHRPDGLHALGNPLLRTPNLDRLVECNMDIGHARDSLGLWLPNA